MFWYSSMIILVPALILMMYAQYKVKSTYAKYSKVGVRSGLRGVDVAERILRDAGVSVSEVTPIPGNLTDHYDPRRRAMLALANGGYLEPDELKGAQAVLSAAALTYVAAAMMAAFQLLRMIMISRRR